MNSTDPFDLLKEEYIPQVIEFIEKNIQKTLPKESPLIDMIHYHLSTGGKRLRALIPLRFAQLFGEDPQELIPFAATAEILHNATLIHDDLQDGDLTRRNKPTVWNKYGAPSAINAGDALFYLAIALPLISKTFSTEIQLALIDTVTRYTLMVIDGQEREFSLHKIDYPSWEMYEKMVRGKTSGLFCIPLIGTSKYLNLGKKVEQQLEKAAWDLGLLFQIQDDLLDIYGQKGRTERCSDLREGKLSALAVLALDQLREDDPIHAEWLREMLRKERHLVSENDIDRALQLFEKSHVLDSTLAKIKVLARRASSSVEENNLKIFIDELVEIFLKPIESLLEYY